MENIDPALVQQFLQNYSNNSGEGGSQPLSLIPQELIDMLAVGIIALTVISALFVLAYVVGTIRKWKVQSAILDMHKDVRELKELMASDKTPAQIDRDTTKIA